VRKGFDNYVLSDTDTDELDLIEYNEIETHAPQYGGGDINESDDELDIINSTDSIYDD
jgi:hypothetical protein